ncbi:hypothetical protein CAPTEDRAFT_186535 [Capitella teleta]|uniref:Transposable element P transposase-like GTP-binding insertion domain-containing protein n=1 Tax=Capitella teleta TaxID=283909 RepID=R7V2S2_CAPTE|nr:hypothetical protein CAPTEDRAFT_186535 [Capitella teleta]|eukprot:ELU12849.1 hypothetical protein CAPTEDRAFT_186535 [Capitella teleta]
MGESKLNNVKEEAEKIDCTSPHIADDSIQRMKQATTADTTLQTLIRKKIAKSQCQFTLFGGCQGSKGSVLFGTIKSQTESSIWRCHSGNEQEQTGEAKNAEATSRRGRCHVMQKIEQSDSYTWHDVQSYVSLRDALCSRITLYNARRGGEPSRLKLKQWRDAVSKQWIDKETELDEWDKKAVHDNGLITCMSGKGPVRLVPVIFPKDCIPALELISDPTFRKKVGIPYVSHLFIVSGITYSCSTLSEDWPPSTRMPEPPQAFKKKTSLTMQGNMPRNFVLMIENATRKHHWHGTGCTHVGTKKTRQIMKQNFYWQTMANDIDKWRCMVNYEILPLFRLFPHFERVRFVLSDMGDNIDRPRTCGPLWMSHIDARPGISRQNIQGLLQACGELQTDIGKVRWQDIAALHSLQDKENLRAANKLTKGHIQFKNRKMNVKLAAQTLSSQSPLARGFKHPLNATNWAETKIFMRRTQYYLMTICDNSGKRIVEEGILVYIAGWVVRKIVPKVPCLTCRYSLIRPATEECPSSSPAELAPQHRATAITEPRVTSQSSSSAELAPQHRVTATAEPRVTSQMRRMSRRGLKIMQKAMQRKLRSAKKVLLRRTPIDAAEKGGKEGAAEKREEDRMKTGDERVVKERKEALLEDREARLLEDREARLLEDREDCLRTEKKDCLRTGKRDCLRTEKRDSFRTKKRNCLRTVKRHSLRTEKSQPLKIFAVRRMAMMPSLWPKHKQRDN